MTSPFRKVVDVVTKFIPIMNYLPLNIAIEFNDDKSQKIVLHSVEDVEDNFYCEEDLDIYQFTSRIELFDYLKKYENDIITRIEIIGYNDEIAPIFSKNNI